MRKGGLPEGQHQGIYWYIGGHYGHGHGANKERVGFTIFDFYHCLAQRSQYLQGAKMPSCMEVGYSAIQQQQLTWFLHCL